MEGGFDKAGRSSLAMAGEDGWSGLAQEMQKICREIRLTGATEINDKLEKRQLKKK